MRIAFDLEGTLATNDEEFPCESSLFLSQLLMPYSPRQGARSLVQDLVRAGHTLTLYTQGRYPLWRVRLWCQWNALPIATIVVGVPTKEQALIVDNDPAVVEAVRQRGGQAFLVTHSNPDWTLGIRRWCLGETGK